MSSRSSVGDTREGQKEGGFIWHGEIYPGKVVLVGGWDMRGLWMQSGGSNPGSPCNINGIKVYILCTSRVRVYFTDEAG